MKKRAEIAVAALAVMFVCFALGYFVGRRSIPSEVLISSGTVVITPAAVPSDSGNGHAVAAESAVPPETPAPDQILPEKTESAQPTVSPDSKPPETSTPATETPIQSTPVPDSSNTPEPHYTADGLLRINYATQAELETLPGIGEVLASRIVEYRERNGSFSKLTTLKVINGIGDARYNAIKDLITVE